ncbi:ABC transporter ATP-binding protein [Nocardioides sp. zg-DK7169]|uniref:ABC transporter ATP-binding protein n=1 Tax=Nocardioides sp. zg-DK7169 TaxID=2736600 RepID=UPI0015535E9E|nr:ABC transporter ATP-binding protein [Nocardioides sp. zg-DK7169]NPC97771.1 ABC transporter ATP-binding protein [Nocardioides sp. zg-DK7169]
MTSLPDSPPRGVDQAPASDPVLRVERLRKTFPVSLGRRRTTLHAVDEVSFTISRGETYALVGESGCGKSSVARCVTRLHEPTDGLVEVLGTDVTHLSRRELRPLRPGFQLVFQDPFSSLDPSHTVAALVSEPLRVQRRPHDRDLVAGLLAEVGLGPELLKRRPHELSGGQRQRVVIARSLALGPDLLVLDEPVAALDASVQAQVINVLRDLQRRRGLAYLFISHDLGVVANLADRIGVMYLGRIVEEGTVEEVLGAPQHPYTQALVSAIPVSDPAQRDSSARIRLQGEPPSPIDRPTGCSFAPRCWLAEDRCRTETPALVRRAGTDHPVACLLTGDPVGAGRPVAG